MQSAASLPFAPVVLEALPLCSYVAMVRLPHSAPAPRSCLRASHTSALVLLSKCVALSFASLPLAPVGISQNSLSLRCRELARLPIPQGYFQTLSSQNSLRVCGHVAFVMLNRQPSTGRRFPHRLPLSPWQKQSLS